jgi:hypothetical protein
MLSKQCPGQKRVENFIDTACKVVLTLSSSEDLSYWLVGLAREMRRACPLDTAARGVVKVSSNSCPKTALSKRPLHKERKSTRLTLVCF